MHKSTSICGNPPSIHEPHIQRCVTLKECLISNKVLILKSLKLSNYKDSVPIPHYRLILYRIYLHNHHRVTFLIKKFAVYRNNNWSNMFTNGIKMWLWRYHCQFSWIFFHTNGFWIFVFYGACAQLHHPQLSVNSSSISSSSSSSACINSRINMCHNSQVQKNKNTASSKPACNEYAVWIWDKHRVSLNVFTGSWRRKNCSSFWKTAHCLNTTGRERRGEKKLKC